MASMPAFPSRSGGGSRCNGSFRRCRRRKFDRRSVAGVVPGLIREPQDGAGDDLDPLRSSNSSHQALPRPGGLQRFSNWLDRACGLCDLGSDRRSWRRLTVRNRARMRQARPPVERDLHFRADNPISQHAAGARRVRVHRRLAWPHERALPFTVERPFFQPESGAKFPSV